MIIFLNIGIPKYFNNRRLYLLYYMSMQTFIPGLGGKAFMQPVTALSTADLCIAFSICRPAGFGSHG